MAIAKAPQCKVQTKDRGNGRPWLHIPTSAELYTIGTPVMASPSLNRGGGGAAITPIQRRNEDRPPHDAFSQLPPAPAPHLRSEPQRPPFLPPPPGGLPAPALQ